MSPEVKLSTLASCVVGQWWPRIGDPTMAGWGTVVAYAVCAVLGLMTLLRLENSRERVFWGLLTFAMLLLGMNKQFDLQSMLTAVGRCLSQLQGWYEERRLFQRNFIIGLIIMAVIFLATVLWLMREYIRRNGIALIGLAIVTTFVAVRAVGFQHVDALINSRVHDVRFNVLFELSGLVLIAINAIVLRATCKGEPPAVLRG